VPVLPTSGSFPRDDSSPRVTIFFPPRAASFFLRAASFSCSDARLGDPSPSPLLPSRDATPARRSIAASFCCSDGRLGDRSQQRDRYSRAFPSSTQLQLRYSLRSSLLYVVWITIFGRLGVEDSRLGGCFGWLVQVHIVEVIYFYSYALVCLM